MTVGRLFLIILAIFALSAIVAAIFHFAVFRRPTSYKKAIIVFVITLAVLFAVFAAVFIYAITRPTGPIGLKEYFIGDTYAHADVDITLVSVTAADKISAGGEEFTPTEGKRYYIAVIKLSAKERVGFPRNDFRLSEPLSYALPELSGLLNGGVDYTSGFILNKGEAIELSVVFESESAGGFIYLHSERFYILTSASGYSETEIYSK